MDARSRLGMRHRDGSNIRYFDRLKLLLKEVRISVPFSDRKMGLITDKRNAVRQAKAVRRTCFLTAVGRKKMLRKKNMIII